MTDTQFSAAVSAYAGVTHIRHRHDEKFTVVGNHLAQHKDLSACAIGIGVYIQSLPDGALVGIKVLAARFPEGEARIAHALRELEAAGYLKRKVERAAGAKLATRTYWYENPHRVDLVKRRHTVPARVRAREAPALAEELRPAASLLAGLRQADPRLLLSENDVRCLAPAVRTWLERGVEAPAVVRTLAGGLPAGTIRWPARLLAHRLREWLPPALPPAPTNPAERTGPLPMQTCEGCDRAFRAAAPGKCRDCRGCREARGGGQAPDGAPVGTPRRQTSETRGTPGR
ncbi:helix-turn-helix domain-containing protein [Streptomyces sp. NPDC003027]